MGMDVSGHKGGLFFAWAADITYNVLQVSENWIHVSCYDSDGINFWITCVYGMPNVSVRHILWDFIKWIGAGCNVPWLLIGDFNQILNNSEKLSRNSKTPGALTFKQTLNHCDLIDLKPVFTWNNGREGTQSVWERLDRALVNDDWLNRFPATALECLPIVASDHNPLSFSLERLISFKHRPKRLELM